MKIESRKLSQINPFPNNPRLNDHAVDAVAKSIQEFGFRQPIVVDPDGVIIIGHTRYKSSNEAGSGKSARPNQGERPAVRNGMDARAPAPLRPQDRGHSNSPVDETGARNAKSETSLSDIRMMP